MRGATGWLMGVMFLAILSAGCGGSTANDRLVLRVIGFNGDNITQEDAVGTNNANIDVVRDCCSLTAEGCQTFENITETSINVVFRNEEAADIRLERYVTEVSDRRIAQAAIPNGTINATIQGGTCDTPAGRQCAVDADCAQGATLGTCGHTNVTVSDLLLFDIFAKQIVHDHPEAQGQAVTVTFTFYGSDPLQSFRATADYVVTFGDFDHCSTTTTSGTGAS